MKLVTIISMDNGGEFDSYDTISICVLDSTDEEKISLWIENHPITEKEYEKYFSIYPKDWAKYAKYHTYIVPIDTV